VSEPDLPRGERVLARGHIENGQSNEPIVATMSALYAGDLVIPWDRILSAQWDEPWLTMLVSDEAYRESTQLRYQLHDSRKFLDVVRDRVTASVLVTERRTLPCGVVATFAARRRSQDGSIHWTVVFDGSPDTSDPQLRAEADSVLSDLRGSLGI
jgi:hypothetical protein